MPAAVYPSDDQQSSLNGIGNSDATVRMNGKAPGQDKSEDLPYLKSHSKSPGSGFKVTG